jgi:hypothetical protein
MTHPSIRLDLRRKELIAHKEDLLKQSKIKLATVESVKMQIDTLMKVRVASFPTLSVSSSRSTLMFSGCCRNSEKSGRAGTVTTAIRCHNPRGELGWSMGSTFLDPSLLIVPTLV